MLWFYPHNDTLQESKLEETDNIRRAGLLMFLGDPSASTKLSSEQALSPASLVNQLPPADAERILGIPPPPSGAKPKLNRGSQLVAQMQVDASRNLGLDHQLVDSAQPTVTAEDVE